MMFQTSGESRTPLGHSLYDTYQSTVENKNRTSNNLPITTKRGSRLQIDFQNSEAETRIKQATRRKSDTEETDNRQENTPGQHKLNIAPGKCRSAAVNVRKIIVRYFATAVELSSTTTVEPVGGNTKELNYVFSTTNGLTGKSRLDTYCCRKHTSQ